MKRKIMACGAAAVMLALAAVGARAKADLGGTWVLDKSRTEGLPPGMDQTMTVTQAEDLLKIETRITTPAGEQTVPDSYVLSGKEVEFTPPVPGGGGGGKGKRTSKWAADGNGIEVTEEATFDTPDGPATVRAARRWSLAADGKTLTIEMSVEGPQGKSQSKRTFVRK